MIIILPRSLTLALRPLGLSDLEDVSRLIRASPSSHRHCSPLPVCSASCVLPSLFNIVLIIDVFLSPSEPGQAAGGRGPSLATLLSHHGSLSSATEGKSSPLLRRHCATRFSEVAKCATAVIIAPSGVSVSRVLIAARLVGNFSYFQRGRRIKINNTLSVSAYSKADNVTRVQNGDKRDRKRRGGHTSPSLTTSACAIFNATPRSKSPNLSLCLFFLPHPPTPRAIGHTAV